MAARDAEHILDAGFLKHAADQFADWLSLGEHPLDCHDASPTLCFGRTVEAESEGVKPTSYEW
jgi:hypothetical protein